MQFFYTEKMQDRQRLAEQINDLSAPHDGSPDEAQMRRNQRKSALHAYNLLNTILKLPQENPDEELEMDIEAARRGETPAFLKDRVRG